MSDIRRFAKVRDGSGREVWVEIDGDRARVLAKAPWLHATHAGETLSLAEVTRVAPVAPQKILCVGRNYRSHAKELGNEVPVEPMLFYKPSSSLLAPGGVVVLPRADISSRVDFESELAVVVEKRLFQASEEEARDAIFGFTIACDVTARDLQKKDGQWWRAKGMDTFCPVGPDLVTGLDVDALRIVCTIDGAERQNGEVRDMIFSIPKVLAHVSQVMTIEPGDLFLTGTPEGVGPLAHGNDVSITIEPIGTLRFTVRAS